MTNEARREKARDAMAAEPCDTPESCRRYDAAQRDFDESYRRTRARRGAENRAVEVDCGE